MNDSYSYHLLPATMVKMGVYQFRDTRFNTWSFDDHSLNEDLKVDNALYEEGTGDKNTYYFTYETQSLHEELVPLDRKHNF